MKTRTERNAEIVDLIRKGLQLTEIARRYGISHQHVSRIGLAVGVRGLRRRLPEEKIAAGLELIARGMPISRAGESIGVADLYHALVRRKLHEPEAGVMDPWSDRHVAILRRHYGQPGWSAARIGERLGRTRNEVIGKAHRLGLGASAKRAAA